MASRLKDIDHFLEKHFYRQHYLHRHFFLVAIFVLIFSIIIVTAALSFLNEDVGRKAQNASIITQKSLTSRGNIIDRNGVILAGNSIVNNVILSPPSNIASIGFDNVTSIWRIKEKCINKKNIYNKECAYKNLAKQAKKLWKKGEKSNDFLTSVNLIKLITTALKIDDLTDYVNKNKQRCLDKQQKFKELKAKKTPENIIKQEIVKLPKCVEHKVLRKKLAYFGPIMKNIRNLKREKFLICKTAGVKKGNKQKIIDLWLGWLLGVDDEKIKTSCWVQKINGLLITIEDKRFYSQSPSTTPVLGRVRDDKYGAYGIEEIFDSYLHEKTSNTTISKNNNSWKNPYDKVNTANSNNKDLILTLDSEIQFHLFNAIKNSVIKHQAEYGAGIIIDTSGEIIAIASFPTSDANLGLKKGNEIHYKNRPLSDSIDVASTIKPFIALIALESGVLQKDEMVDITKGEGIESFKPKKNRPFINIHDIIKESHSLGSIKIGKKIDNEVLFNHLVQLQFGTNVAVLPKIETSGFLRNFYYWTPTDKKRLSFGGYGVISSSLAQIARAYGVFANDGVIKNLKLFPHTEHIEEKIFSSQNIEFIKNTMIASVNEGGTGKRAKLNDYVAFGKTGTAQLLIDGKYSNSKHSTLFAGIAPSNQPKYIMVVHIKAPNGYYLDGGSVAAPIFKEVMDKIL